MSKLRKSILLVANNLFNIWEWLKGTRKGDLLLLTVELTSQKVYDNPKCCWPSLVRAFFMYFWLEDFSTTLLDYTPSSLNFKFDYGITS